MVVFMPWLLHGMLRGTCHSVIPQKARGYSMSVFVPWNCHCMHHVPFHGLPTPWRVLPTDYSTGYAMASDMVAYYEGSWGTPWLFAVRCAMASTMICHTTRAHGTLHGCIFSVDTPGIPRRTSKRFMGAFIAWGCMVCTMTRALGYTIALPQDE